jgi:hypothetical protein
MAMTLAQLTNLMNRFVADKGWYCPDSRVARHPGELAGLRGSICLS